MPGYWEEVERDRIWLWDADEEKFRGLDKGAQESESGKTVANHKIASELDVTPEQVGPFLAYPRNSKLRHRWNDNQNPLALKLQNLNDKESGILLPLSKEERKINQGLHLKWKIPENEHRRSVEPEKIDWSNGWGKTENYQWFIITAKNYWYEIDLSDRGAWSVENEEERWNWYFD